MSQSKKGVNGSSKRRRKAVGADVRKSKKSAVTTPAIPPAARSLASPGAATRVNAGGAAKTNRPAKPNGKGAPVAAPKSTTGVERTKLGAEKAKMPSKATRDAAVKLATAGKRRARPSPVTEPVAAADRTPGSAPEPTERPLAPAPMATVRQARHAAAPVGVTAQVAPAVGGASEGRHDQADMFAAVFGFRAPGGGLLAADIAGPLAAIAGLSRANLNAMLNASSLAARGARDIGRQLAAYGHEDLNGGLNTLRALLAAKSVPDAAVVQAEFARDSLEKVMSRSTELSRLTLRAAQQAAEPVGEQLAKGLKGLGIRSS